MKIVDFKRHLSTVNTGTASSVTPPAFYPRAGCVFAEKTSLLTVLSQLHAYTQCQTDLIDVDANETVTRVSFNLHSHRFIRIRMKLSNDNSTLPLYETRNVNGVQKCNNAPTDKVQQIKIIGIDLTHCSGRAQFLSCCFGVFALYLIYGYLQELIFTLDGFKPFGWFLTLIQFGYYTIFAYFERRIGDPSQSAVRKIPMKTYALLAFLTLGTMGLSNSSLGYLNYPTQVIFKCCKLVPVLIGSILIQKKKHGPLDFIAAIAMCVGLTLFTLGKFASCAKTSSLITISILCSGFTNIAEFQHSWSCYDFHGVSLRCCHWERARESHARTSGLKCGSCFLFVRHRIRLSACDFGCHRKYHIRHSVLLDCK